MTAPFAWNSAIIRALTKAHHAGMSDAAFGKQYGIGSKTVQKARSRLGIHRPQAHRTQRDFRWTSHLLDRLRALCDDDTPDTKIAIILECHVDTIAEARKAHGIVKPARDGNPDKRYRKVCKSCGRWYERGAGQRLSNFNTSVSCSPDCAAAQQLAGALKGNDERRGKDWPTIDRTFRWPEGPEYRFQDCPKAIAHMGSSGRIFAAPYAMSYTGNSAAMLAEGGVTGTGRRVGSARV